MPGKFTPGGRPSRALIWTRTAARIEAQVVHHDHATQKMIERIPLEVINNNKFELIDELYATDYVEHTRPAGRSPDARRFQADRDRAEEGLSRPAIRSTTWSTAATGSCIA